MSPQPKPVGAAVATGLATTAPATAGSATAGRFESGAPVRGHRRGHIRGGHDDLHHDLHHDLYRHRERGRDLRHDHPGHVALGHHHPAITVRKDSPAMTATAHRPSAPAVSPIPTVVGRGPSAGELVSRWRLSGWGMARVLLLLAAQISMLVALLTDHAGAATPTASAYPDAVTTAAVSRTAFTAPLARGAAAMVPEPGSSGSVSCAGHSPRGGGADAAGYNLNIALGGGGGVGGGDRGWSGSGPGPLVVTCGQRGRLVILACAPLGADSGRDSGRDPASWERPFAGGGASWWGAWRGDWRDRGFGPGVSDDQLRLLNQLDPDRLRALLGQRDLTTYPGTAYPGSGYSGTGYGGGLGAGLVVGGMRISVGGPVSYGQLPSAGAWGGTWNPAPGYGGDSYGPGYGYSSGGYGYGGPGPEYGTALGPSYGPSSWNGTGDPDDPGSPILISHHHGSDSHADDNSGDDHRDGGGDGDRGGDRDWRGSSSGTAGPVAVCRSIGQR